MRALKIGDVVKINKGDTPLIGEVTTVDQVTGKMVLISGVSEWFYMWDCTILRFASPCSQVV